MPSEPPVLEGLEAVTVHITDVEKARRFYGGVLGLRELAYEPERQRLVYELPNSTTRLTMHVMTDPREGGRDPGTVSGLVFRHPEPGRAVEEIRRRGGAIVVEPMRMPWGLVRAVIADFDGNEFIVASPAPAK